MTLPYVITPSHKIEVGLHVINFAAI